MTHTKICNDVSVTQTESNHNPSLQTPRQAGFRWPAEWEAHSATWLSWPHNRETWRNYLDQAEASFVRMVEALYTKEQVSINVNDEAMETHVRSCLRHSGLDDNRVEYWHFASDDAWVRDHGPIFLLREKKWRARDCLRQF